MKLCAGKSGEGAAKPRLIAAEHMPAAVSGAAKPFILTLDSAGGICYLIAALMPLLLRLRSDISYIDTEVIKEINEIKRLTDQANVNFQTVKRMILQCTAKKFVCCTCCDREAYTEHLHRAFSKWDPCDSLDILFLKKITDKITVERDGSITITFINQAEIREGDSRCNLQ